MIREPMKGLTYIIIDRSPPPGTGLEARTHARRKSCSKFLGTTRGRGLGGYLYLFSFRIAWVGRITCPPLNLFRAPGEKFSFTRGPGPPRAHTIRGWPGPPGRLRAPREYGKNISEQEIWQKRIGTRESGCHYRVNNNKKIRENQVTACFRYYIWLTWLNKYID